MASVLVVGDDPAIRHLVRDPLHEDGYDTEEAGDGLVALEKVRHSVPDLVVLDLFMPRMDGQEFLNVCRLVPGCASPAISRPDAAAFLLTRLIGEFAGH